MRTLRAGRKKDRSSPGDAPYREFCFSATGGAEGAEPTIRETCGTASLPGRSLFVQYDEAKEHTFEVGETETVGLVLDNRGATPIAVDSVTPTPVEGLTVVVESFDTTVTPDGP